MRKTPPRSASQPCPPPRDSRILTCATPESLCLASNFTAEGPHGAFCSAQSRAQPGVWALHPRPHCRCQCRGLPLALGGPAYEFAPLDVSVPLPTGLGCPVLTVAEGAACVLCARPASGSGAGWSLQPLWWLRRDISSCFFSLLASQLYRDIIYNKMHPI